MAAPNPTTMRLYPAPGARVREPGSAKGPGKLVPPEGIVVAAVMSDTGKDGKVTGSLTEPADPYWWRKLTTGDMTAEAPPASAPAKAGAQAPAAPAKPVSGATGEAGPNAAAKPGK